MNLQQTNPPRRAGLKPVYSMTGFARSSGASASQRWTWEVRSVNGRGLEVRFRLPNGFDSLEAGFRERIAGRLARGNVQATLTLQRDSAAGRLRVNEEMLSELLALAERLQPAGNLAPLSIDGILSLRGMVEVSEEGPDEAIPGGLAEVLIDGLGEAVDALVAARRREGDALHAAIAVRVDEIERLTRAAHASPGRGADSIRRRLTEQVEALLATGVPLDPQRLHQEAALLATRADVAEELDRLTAHIAAARALLEGGSPLGRQLDFLVQEFNREANTLCSKANDIALTAIGLDMKTAIDQLREQVQNLE